MNLNNFFVEPSNNGNGYTIGYGVLGSSVLIKKRFQRWSGQMEYCKLLKYLTHNENVSNVIMLSSNDLHNLSLTEKEYIDPYNKIINAGNFCRNVENIKLYSKYNSDDEKFDNEQRYFKQLNTYIQSLNINIDLSLCFMSYAAYTLNSLPGYLLRKYNQRPKALESCLRYASPLVHFFNCNKQIPWYLIATDCRYLNVNRMRPIDLVNIPKKIISQYNETINWEHIKDYTKNPTLISETVEACYSGIEKLNTCYEKIYNPENLEKQNKFVIVSMEVEHAPKEKDFRFNALKTWLLDYDKDNEIIIYGKWRDEKTKGYPQFKGLLESDKLNDIFLKTKYTLVLPTKIKIGWATSKPWEMLQLAVVPFFHCDFDNQYNMVPKDSYLRCKNPEEFYEKMKELDNDDSKRIELIKDLQKKYMENSEEILNKTLNNNIPELAL